MAQRKRYLFHGNASGVAVRIRRPEDLQAPVQGCSSLPTTGGLSESKVGPKTIGDPKNPYVTFDSATTRAHGDFADLTRAVEITHGRVGHHEVPTVTQVRSEVTNLAVLGRVKVGRAVLVLESRSATDGQPPISCHGSVLEGVSVDGYGVVIDLGIEFFCECDTHSKLAKAAESGRNRHCFFEAGKAGSYGFDNPAQLVKCTMVTNIRWEGQPHPNAVIEGNSIRIPELGTVYFAELFITHASRRGSMVRFELGSPVGGDISAADGESNGETYPPSP